VPFDKISPRQLLLMRLITAAMFMAAGIALVILGSQAAVDMPVLSLPAQLSWAQPVSALVFGVFAANAGMMLLELTTKPPMKVAINVPFVAANFQVSLCFGLIAVGVAIAAGGSALLTALVIATFGLNFMFVLMTKLHWNFTENTGKPLPKA
jgi:hypothetical protein